METALASPKQANVFLQPNPVNRAEWGKPLLLETIADLHVCTSVIADAARMEFFKRNPKRKRISPKFGDRFRLRLDYEQRGDNPKAPVIYRDTFFRREINQHFNEFLARHQFEDEYKASRDHVIEAIVNANLGRPVSGDAPISILRKLGIGSAGKVSNGLVLHPDFRGHECVFNKDTRATFRKIGQVTSDRLVEVTGIICAVDIYHRTFKVLTQDKEVIPVKFRTELTPKVRSIFDNYIESRVGIRGIAKINYLENIISIDNIQEFDEIMTGQAGLDYEGRLAEISGLEPGWYEGEGVKLEAAALGLTHDLIKNLKELFSIPVPYIYPMPDGNIELEWTQDQWEISLTLDFGASEAQFFAFDKSRRHKEEMDLPLEHVADLSDAVAELYNFLLFEGA